MPKEKECDFHPTKASNLSEEVEAQQMEIVEEADDEEMELGELDLDAIEVECGNKGKGYVPRWKIELLHKAIIKEGACYHLSCT